MLPHFLVIGGMKCGTTALWHYLRRHPDIWVPQKNVEFFVSEKWSNGPSWYERFFEDAEAGSVVGEVSSEYAKHPYRADAPGRIREVLPNVRLVYLVRHPIERAVSHYCHMVNYGTERRGAREALLAEDNNQYLAFSMYNMQVKEYLKHFDRGQLLVIRSEDLRWRPGETVNRIFRFLGVAEREIEPVTAQTRDQKRQWNRLGQWLRSAPRRADLYSYYMQRLPDSLARTIQAGLSRPIHIDARSGWYREVADRMSGDVQAFYELVGERFWGDDLTAAWS